MCAKITQYSRLSHHTIAGSANAGLTFSVPGSEDFTDGTWTAYDLALSEIGVNEEDCKVYIRIDNDIKEFQMVGSTAGGENLSQTLALGNNTGGQNIVIDNGDIIGSNGTTDEPNIQFINALVGGPKLSISAGNNIFGITQTGYIDLASNGVAITSDSNNFSESYISVLSTSLTLAYPGVQVLLGDSAAKIGRDLPSNKNYSKYLQDSNATINRLSVEDVNSCLTEEYFRAKPFAQTGEANYHYRLFTDNTNDNHDIILYFDSNGVSYGKYAMATIDLNTDKHLITPLTNVTFVGQVQRPIVTQQGNVRTLNATPDDIDNNSGDNPMEIDITGFTTTVVIEANVVGMENGATFSYGSKLFGVFKSVAGTVTQVGTTDLVERSDFTTATSGFSITSNIIRLNVTGEAATTIDWSGNWTYKILTN